MAGKLSGGEVRTDPCRGSGCHRVQGVRRSLLRRHGHDRADLRAGAEVRTEYCVEISNRDRQLGAGFLLTRHHVLTAFHCVRPIDTDDEHLKLSFATGEVVPGRFCERSSGADLALIDVLKPLERSFILPNADRAGRGDMWSAPYRPSKRDPYLSGDVLRGTVTYKCDAGHEIEALQLGCRQLLGDYSGYSGGPVERHGPGEEPTLLGVLLEQYPDRQAPERASGVLFAATIAEALRRFDCLGVGHLLKVLFPDDGEQEECAPTTTSDERHAAMQVQEKQKPHSPITDSSLKPRIAAANSILGALHEWGSTGLLDPMAVSSLKLRVASRVVDSNWADDA
jgi:Trypsin-like peptidase domain